ncbi:TetR/AcrR family transcriptional regulator [Mycolicibacterium sp. 018/SC-01/001]|uniref:TetR/AcrR family transcriptional regulator n=1 Tax=Mycolicibacterium sp. 018/SC-01/001 TaxID=2592069 RepID=UPI00117C253C|nr:TetR/AcrR family transcriptional regulator [Mycolicibacterium sp. 018/SC-01/001]TRW82055.1 TetR/AcrR family transcriptional regulator [Mycolicibacterium sp. 018/SC-01/001]
MGVKRDVAETTAMILAAALELGDELGFESLTVERLAQRTGVAKTTIYRRWPNISTVVMDAFLAEAQAEAPIADMPSARESLAASLRSLAALYRGRHGDSLRALIARAQADNELRQAVVDRWVEPRREVARAVIRRGMATEEFRSGLDPDVVLDMLYGPIYHRLLVPYRNADLSDAYVDSLIDSVLHGISR